MGYVGLWRCYLRYLSDEVTVSLSVEYFFWSGVGSCLFVVWALSVFLVVVSRLFGLASRYFLCCCK